MVDSIDNYIKVSHQRCLNEFNMTPKDRLIPKVCITKNKIKEIKDNLGNVISVARKFMTKLISDLEHTPVLIVISNNEGIILELYGDESIKGQIESLGLSIGIQFTEEELGTNSVSLALHLDQPIQMIGKDHFHESLHESACFSVPFTNGGEVEGTISVMMAAQNASSFHLGLLKSAVDSIEREVKVNKQNKELLILNQVIVENSRNGIIITNEDGLVIELNPYAEQILGCNKYDVMHQSVKTIDSIGHYMKDVIEGKMKYEDVEIKVADKILLFDSYPIYDDRHEIIGAFGQLRNITERLLLEKQLMASEKLSDIGKISAGLAHEIRNPLTSIIGLMQLFKAYLKPEDKKLEDYFRIIFSELERIKSLVQQFVLMAKPNQREITKSYTQIQELMQDTITLMESQLSSKNIQLSFDCTYNDKTYVDKDKLKQVFINILQNSLDATGEDGKVYISVRLSEDNQFIEIKIEDNGIGMDEETVKKLATPFFSTKENGLGLGMAMSYNIIELHKGKVFVHSEKGKGTTFTIWLPTNGSH
ncbi:ATP-binding protein [Alkalihalobacterium bogoriense]|uniref:ATP-binding protein n=1 Tax=Alkalihalobacterium bogoriense TaxID=246272 RepID=UPI00047B7D02|nr:ATP-binding protein [Alkalihalobacterium bogoriense]